MEFDKLRNEAWSVCMSNGPSENSNMAALVIAEHDNISLKSATLHTIRAAIEISVFSDGLVDVLVAGHGASSVAESATDIKGVGQVLYADAPGLAPGSAESVAAQVLAVSPGCSHILFPGTLNGKRAAPHVAASLGVAHVSDVTGVVCADTFELPADGRHAIATGQCDDAIKVLTVQTTGFDAAEGSGGFGAITFIPAASGAKSGAGVR